MAGARKLVLKLRCYHQWEHEVTVSSASASATRSSPSRLKVAGQSNRKTGSHFSWLTAYAGARMHPRSAHGDARSIGELQGTWIWLNKVRHRLPPPCGEGGERSEPGGGCAWPRASQNL